MVGRLNAITGPSWSTINMARDSKIRALSIASLQVGALLLLTCAAFAAPPQGRLQPHALTQVQAPQHLDLRPPSHALEAGNAAEKSPGNFPSMARRLNSAQEPLELPALGSNSMRARPTVQEFVRRVHSEGLPVARLLET
jgi:hypothetical protein